MNWNDEELSRALTEAYDARLDAAEASGKQAKEQANRLPSFEEAYAAAERRREGAVPTDPPGNLRAVPARRAWLRPAIAAVLALAILGGGFLLLRGRLHRKGPEQPALQEKEAGLSREQILAMANGLTPDGGELIFDDYVGAVQRCQVFREDYGYCCVIRDVYNKDHFFGIFLFDADRRLTQTLEGRAVKMPEGETLDAKLLGHGLEEIQREYGEPLFDAGSGFCIPTWFTDDGRLISVHGVDGVADPVAKITERDVLTEGSMPVRTDRFTDEELERIYDEASGTSAGEDFDALVRNYQGVLAGSVGTAAVIVDTDTVRTALFYGQTKLLRIEEYTKADGTKELRQQYVPLSVAAAQFDEIHAGDALDKVYTLDPDGEYLFMMTGVQWTEGWVSSHYTEDGWLLGITYRKDPQDPDGLVVDQITRTRLAYVYTYYAQEPAETKTEIEHYSDEEIESLYAIIQDDPMSTEEKITLIRLNKGFFGTTVNDDRVLWSYAYIYGKTELLYLSWPAEAGDDRKVSGCLFPLSPEKSVFEAITPGTSLEEVRTLDPDGQYLFLYTGVQLPPGSTHYTEDGYVVAVAYRNEGNGLVVERVECTHIPDLAPLPPETEPVAYDAPVNAAIDFLTLLARNEYLYENNTLIERTVAALPEEDRQAIKVNSAAFAPYTELRKVQGLPVGDHVDYILEKQAYWRRSRQEQGITRENFVPTYTCRGERISDGVARIIVEENLTWYYTGHSEPSALEVIHEVFLYEYDGAWYVFDIFSDDGYDCTHKADLSQAGE